jgi:hypothetical protein
MKGAEKAALALWAAIGAGIAGTVALTQKTAEMGNELAKSSQRLGVAVEALQELDYAASQSGVNDLRGHLDKLNKTMGDVKSGTGTLTKYLNENDKQLLGQLKNVKSNEEAFMLLMDSVGKAPDEFTKAKLATEYFGKAGNDLIIMANQGAEGIEALREEAQKYGVMSAEAARQSKEYMDAQTRLKAALTGVQTELTSKLLPGITGAVNGITNFIASVDDWEKILKIAGYALAGLTAGVTAFLIISKGEAAIKTMATAFKALNTAIAANPIGAIAVVITAVLIPALIYLWKNWDTVQTYISQGVARLEYAFKWFTSQIKEKFVIAVNGVKIAFISLAEIIVTKVLGAVANLLEVMGKLPFVGEQFQRASQSVRNFANGFSEAADSARQSSRETIKAAKEEQEAIEAALDIKLVGIDAEAEAKRAALAVKKKQAEEAMALETEAANHEIEETKRASEETKRASEAKLQTLKEHLEQIALTENQALNQSVNEVASFLQQRATLETDSHAERIAYLEQQKEELLALYDEGTMEHVAIERAANEAIKKSQEELAASERELFNKRMGAMSGFFSSMANLMDAFGKENRAAMVLSKLMAVAEIAVNTAVGISNAIAQFGPPPSPLGIAGIASAAATGAAATASVIATSIPSAETGGRFVVPDVSPRVDGVGLRVNPGEEINVTPKGTAGNGQTDHYIFKIDNQTIFDIVNRGLRSGEIHEYSPAWNVA